MNILLYMLAILVPLLIVYAIVASMWRRRKLSASIEATFGKKPTDASVRLRALRFWESCAAHREDAAFVDDITWNDLDMDAVYVNINSCQSGIGDVWLYTTLRMNGGSPQKLADCEDKVSFFDAHPEARKRVQLQLALFGHGGGDGIEVALFHPQALAMPRAKRLVPLAILPFLALLLTPLIGFAWAIAVSVLCMMVNYVLTIYIRTRPENGLNVMQSFAATQGCAGKLRKTLRPYRKDWADVLDARLAPFKKLSLPNAVLVFSEAMTRIGMIDPGGFLLLPVFSYAYIAGKIQQLQNEAYTLVKAVGELDVAISVLALRRMMPYTCLPQWNDDKTLSFEGLYHPLLEEAVPNSATFTRDVLYTGSNASGKSTFIKAVALNCILAQSLNTCLAQHLCLNPGPVLTSMAIQDSVVDGDSYFVAELKSMKRLIQKAQEEIFCYIFIDEILRGTNTVERIAASSTLLLYLSEFGSLTMAATHDMELTTILKEKFDNYHFKESVTEGGVVFDYVLYPGPSKTRNAIVLMEAMQFPPEMVKTSNRLVREFESTNEWPHP